MNLKNKNIFKNIIRINVRSIYTKLRCDPQKNDHKLLRTAATVHLVKNVMQFFLLVSKVISNKS